MKIKSAVFQVSAPDLKSCPKSALPEFAFIGRSNVGKSSLINLLAERRELAKVSVTPGKTKLINFFIMNGCWTLVDLPGYGYAKAAKTERAAFSKSVNDYLEKRRNIACVFVLIDSTLPPQRIDLEFIAWLDSCGVPFVLLFTKTDKQSASRLNAQLVVFKTALSELKSELPAIFVSSARTKSGRTEILNFIQESLAVSPRIEA